MRRKDQPVNANGIYTLKRDKNGNLIIPGKPKNQYRKKTTNKKTVKNKKKETPMNKKNETKPTFAKWLKNTMQELNIENPS